jgi:hypothetical protein
MNIQQIDRTRLLSHLHEVEQNFPLHFVALLSRGTAVHVVDENAIDFLAEKRPGLSLSSLTGAEIDLSKRLDRPVGIVLRSELKGLEEKEVLAQAQLL